MDTNERVDKKIVRYEDLLEIGVKALERVDVPTEDAKTTLEVLLCADLRGIGTHGIQRLTMYVPRLKKGLINPHPKIEIKRLAPALKIVCGDDGLGPVVATKGMMEAISQAKQTGIAFVGCRDSNHFGAAAPYVLMACEGRMIGIASTNALPSMAPWGGLEKLVGNNPLAIGVPIEGGSPFVLDMAMSVSSRGRIRQMADNGESIPEGWAINSQGQSTLDPLEGLKGFVLPIGSFKGYGLAVAIDILSGVLCGAAYSNGVKSLLQQWEEPQHIGHFFIAIDPVRFMTWRAFSAKMHDLCDRLRSGRRIDPETPILVAGDLESKLEKERRAHGIPVDAKTLERLNGLVRGRYEYEIPGF